MRKKKNLFSWKNKTEKQEFLTNLCENSKKEATLYKKEEDYALGDFIEHPNFGLGFIHNIINKTKIEVFFESSEKILLQNWG